MDERIQQMIRVDHAGEHGATRIYDGQLAVFGWQKDKQATVKLIEHMAEQEQAHLSYFDEQIIARDVRPTVFSPFWDMAGFALGAASALMGEKAAMACTAAVETEIDAHYAQQLAELEAADIAPDLRAKIEAFRADEAEHRETALAEGAAQAPAYPLMSQLIRMGCRAAIKVSEKL